MKGWGGRSCVLDKEQRFSHRERERERERYSPMWHFEEKKAKPIASIYRKNDFSHLPIFILSNAIDTNYFTTFLQTTDMTLVFSK